jgi:hypothetical protein
VQAAVNTVIYGCPADGLTIEEELPSGAKAAAEKQRTGRKSGENHPSAAKAAVGFVGLNVRAKARTLQRPSFPQALKPDSFCWISGTTKVVPFQSTFAPDSSAACEVVPFKT